MIILFFNLEGKSRLLRPPNLNRPEFTADTLVILWEREKDQYLLYFKMSSRRQRTELCVRILNLECVFQNKQFLFLLWSTSKSKGRLFLCLVQRSALMKDRGTRCPIVFSSENPDWKVCLAGLISLLHTLNFSNGPSHKIFVQ